MSERLAQLEQEVLALREQLESRAKVAARALAAHQRRVERLSEALRSLEEKDRRLSEDLEQARLFWARSLSAIQTARGLEVSACARPAEVVGGDFYDVSPGDGDGVRIFLADAIGHGVQAALRTMILKSEYERVRGAATPQALLAALNARLVSLYPGLEMQCAAMCLDVVAPGPHGPGRVAFASAALPPVLHLPARGAAREHYRPGGLLGVDADLHLMPDELTLGSGDRLAVYTDGVIEAWNPGGEAFTLGQIIEGVAGPRPLPEATRGLLDHVVAFTGGKGLDDDATVVLVEVS